MAQATPELFGGAGKSPDFSFGSPEDSQAEFTFNIPKPGPAESSKDVPKTNEPGGMETLVAEVRDLKELLKALLKERIPEQQERPSKPTGDLVTAPIYAFYDDAEILDLARNHCPNEAGMGAFREYFLSQFCSSNEWTEEVDDQVAQSHQAVFSCKGPEDSVLRVHRNDFHQLKTAKRPYLKWPERNTPAVRRHLKPEEAKHLVEADWHLGLAQGIKIDGKICIRWKVPLEQFKISWSLLYLYYQKDGNMECGRFDRHLLHAEVEDGLRAAGVPLSQLTHVAFLSALLLHPWDMSSSLNFSDTLDDGNQYTIALDTLRHEIRCFSSRDPNFMGLKFGDVPSDSYLTGNRLLPHHFPIPSHKKPKGLATTRQSGAFPSLLKGLERRFTEKRLSVVCLASDFNYKSGMPSFRIMVVNDFPEITPCTEEDSKNWKTSGIRIEGPASWQMAYQAAIFYLIPFWEREWASCLDELDNSVRVKMEDIMDPNTKDSMMFDASFIRSRFYFEVIQMLRIFSDIIRETGRDLQTMVSDPNMASHLSWKDDHDEALRENSKSILRANWDIVEVRQKDAEKRLLDRITGLSGDMQSLRDGLFNATALLEASRSTAMARYVFVFTVTVFSTQFFNKTEMADTIAVYRDSTIAVALVTYAVAIIMKLQEKDTVLDNAVV
ncbi:hypothetical protein DL766_000067 [Monosporascus sp. MC13-8B]|nr:hypothetical protein DL763_007925 [Monosporascus cannonballus]RYP40043.1 hypothetical protein DL766_000067 [Monosporascus sp. MC13-8B]